MGNSAESATSGVYAPFTQQEMRIRFECAVKVLRYHGVPSMQKGVFWPGKRAVSAWRQACAERTYFCEGVVEKLGDLDASTRTSPMHRHAALCRVCGTEAASIRPSGGRFSPSVWDDRPPWRRGVGKTPIVGSHSGVKSP